MPANDDARSVVAGALAGLLSDGVVHPIDTVRARLQVQAMHQTTTAYTSATQALRAIIRNEGFLALYKGFGAVAFGTIPGHALYFAGYEASKRALEPIKENTGKVGEISVHLSAGFIADVFGSLAWTPMDVIKQRMQTQKLSGHAYASSLHALRSVVEADGVRGLYRGFGVGLYVLSVFLLTIGQRTVPMCPFISHCMKSGRRFGHAARISDPGTIRIAMRQRCRSLCI
jgi:hypothetical protein